MNPTAMKYVVPVFGGLSLVALAVGLVLRPREAPPPLGAVDSPGLAHLGSSPSPAATAEPFFRRPLVAPSAPAATSASAAAGHGAQDAVAALHVALGGDDDAAKIAAIDALAHGARAEGLPALVAVDLAREPAAAPTIIRTVAQLGARGSLRDRTLAATTLARWLEQEIARSDADAVGNVPNLIEALSATGGPEAADVLARTLDSRRLDLPLETLVVQSLGELDDRRARDAVTRFRDRVAATPPSEGFDGELRLEAIAAAQTTARKLQ
jgi:hypothetical protein